jgi:hypothetical protein
MGKHGGIATVPPIYFQKDLHSINTNAYMLGL